MIWYVCVATIKECSYKNGSRNEAGRKVGPDSIGLDHLYLEYGRVRAAMHTMYSVHQMRALVEPVMLKTCEM